MKLKKDRTSTINKDKIQWILSLFFMFGVLGCSLNNSTSSGPKQSQISEDVDFSWDLWPELEENQTLITQKIDQWPEIKPRTILFLGDESLQANWGLIVQNSFLNSGENSWMLSTCMTARDFKNGMASTCGFWTQPFQQVVAGKIYISLDRSIKTERLAPRLISDKNVDKVVISFGHRISAMESRTEIQQELSAIELMAKWAHSAGKTCYVLEPTDALFVETSKNEFLTENEKERLRVSVSEYCEWIEAKTLKHDYLNLSHIDVDTVINEFKSDDSSGFIQVTRPRLNIETPQENIDTKNIETPKNVNDPNMQSLPKPESLEEKISRKMQEKLRERLEVSRPPVKKEVVATQELEEPRYLWNGHAHGKDLTAIGKKYLNSKVASHLLQTRELRDVERFCPQYWSLNEKQREFFWVYLYSAIARYENDRFNPSSTHREKKSGKHSIGIFQVDTENCGYGADSNREKLFDIDNNFKCALQKGTSLVKKGRQVADGRYNQNNIYVDFGMDGYWSVLRRPYQGAAMNSRTGKYQTVSLGRRAQIIKLTSSISICK